jgi:hypothetical protein
MVCDCMALPLRRPLGGNAGASAAFCPRCASLLSIFYARLPSCDAGPGSPLAASDAVPRPPEMPICPSPGHFQIPFPIPHSPKSENWVLLSDCGASPIAQSNKTAARMDASTPTPHGYDCEFAWPAGTLCQCPSKDVVVCTPVCLSRALTLHPHSPSLHPGGGGRL